MPIEQTRSKRKPTGGRIKDRRKSRRYAKSNKPILTQVGGRKTRNVRELGGNRKTRILSAETISVTDPKSKKTKSYKILNVVENPADPNFTRRNILTKGAIIETDAGNVRVTSRPGQQGAIAGVLIGKSE